MTSPYEKYFDCEKKKPKNYDLCFLITESGRKVPGWLTETGWYSRHIYLSEKVKYWKPQRNNYVVFK